jgi:hypothetical protein
MSLKKRSDVKNHLSTRAGSTTFPFGPIDQPNVIRDSESEEHRTKANVPHSDTAVGEPTAQQQA